eukprot:scaffold1452_cov117-Isochrysis_galbana.AAC.11
MARPEPTKAPQKAAMAAMREQQAIPTRIRPPLTGEPAKTIWPTEVSDAFKRTAPLPTAGRGPASAAKYGWMKPAAWN